MCGICGSYYFDGRPIDRGVLESMSDILRHRGPDDRGTFIGEGIGLGHRRLSIIDLSTGQQPLSNEDGSVWIVLNGEIYNYLELNKSLTGHIFRTRSDTETIVHLYEMDPNGFVSRLRGMFALALWDQKNRQLILARDRVGKKPLYYYCDHEKLVFASEIKSILQHPALKLDIDNQAVCDYLSLGYIPAPKSIYGSIRKLRPGYFLRVTRGNLEEVQYWDINFGSIDEMSEQQWTEALLSELETAVRIRLMSEVPLGAFLSGGVDSSAVVAMMARIQTQPVKTATIGFQESAFDESQYARQVSQFLQTDHHERIVTPDKIATIEKLVWHYDEPFADSSALPTYFVSQVAREKVTVALSGDGGDENFAGYRRYYWDRQENRLRTLLPFSLRRAVFGPLAVLYPKMDWAPRFLRAKTTFQSMSFDPLEGYFEMMSTFRRYEKPSVLSEDFKRKLADYDSISVFRDHYDRAGTPDPLSRIQYLDIKTYLTDDILVKVDRASMAHSLEVRCPLLDHKFMELVASMPSNFKLRGTNAKYIFKRALESLLPAEILQRSKMGFGVPLADWFRNGIRDFACTYIMDQQDPFTNSAFIRKIWHQHQSGLRDRSEQLWNILMFRCWYSNRQH
jgi:asparagine synthase (glutamine-hydrolysing)